MRCEVSCYAARGATNRERSATCVRSRGVRRRSGCLRCGPSCLSCLGVRRTHRAGRARAGHGRVRDRRRNGDRHARTAGARRRSVACHRAGSTARRVPAGSLSRRRGSREDVRGLSARPPVPWRSMAQRYRDSGMLPKGPHIVAPGTWIDHPDWVVVLEHSMPTSDPDTVLTMLWCLDQILRHPIPGSSFERHSSCATACSTSCEPLRRSGAPGKR